MPLYLKKLWIKWVLCSPSASSIDEGWLRIMFLALTYNGQSRTMCLIVSGSLYWLQRGCSSCFIKWMWVRLVWPILVLVLVISERLDMLGWVCHLVIFFLINFNLFEIGISSQDVCHILEVCWFMTLFMSWYGRVVMGEDEDEVIASFASVSAFSFPGIPCGREPTWTQLFFGLRKWCCGFGKLSY